MNKDTQHPQSYEELARQEHIALAFDPLQVVDIFVKRFKMIVALTLLFTILGATYLSFQKPYYTASALIQINTPDTAAMPQEAAKLRKDDQAALLSELDILKSPTLTQRVIEKLSLDQKEEFNPTQAPFYKVDIARKAFEDFVDSKGQKNAAPESAEAMRVRINQAVRERLELRKDPLSYTVRLSFTSEDAARAKNIVNAYAHEYIRYQIETQEQENRQASAWLAQRVEALRRDVITSESAVQRYRSENQLAQLNGMTLDNRQLSELSTQLITARGAAAQAHAKLEGAQNAESAPAVLGSTLISRLREQEAALVQKRSELSTQFGPKHPKMAGINSEISDLRATIKTEINKVIASLKSDAQVADARVDDLVREIEFVRSKVSTAAQRETQLQELQRTADVNRGLYESFLTRLKETGEAVNLQQSNAKIIAPALLPLAPSKPNKKLILALFVAFGACLGGLLALVLEYFSQGFSTPGQAEDKLGVYNIGMVPELRNTYAMKTLADLALESSGSIYTEALKRILASLQFAHRHEEPARSIMMTSSLPQEGKGWLTAALARVMAQSGKKVLLIDCDLRRRSIADLFDARPVFTLNDYLSGEQDLQDVICEDEKSGLAFIGSVPLRGPVQPLLESTKIKALMDYAHAQYDMVFIDAPPVIGLSDTLFLAQLVDKTVFVIQAVKTPRRVVMNALQILERAHVGVAGTVLSRVDLEEYKKHEFGNRSFQQKYSAYYQDLRTGRFADKILPFKKRA